MNKTIVSLLLGLAGLLFLAVAVVYFVTPAKSLPGFFPGFDPTLTRHHTTHGIAVLGLALGAFAAAWISTGKKSVKKE